MAVTWQSQDGAVKIHVNGEHVHTGVITASVGKTVVGGGTLALGQVSRALECCLKIFPCVQVA